MKTSAHIEYYIDCFGNVVAYVTLQRGTVERKAKFDSEAVTLAQCKRNVSQRFNIAPCNISSHRFA